MPRIYHIRIAVMYPLFPMKCIGRSLLHAQTPDQLQPPPRCSALLQASAVASLFGPSTGGCCCLAAMPSYRLLPSPLCSAHHQAAAAASLPDPSPGCSPAARPCAGRLPPLRCSALRQAAATLLFDFVMQLMGCGLALA